MKNLIRYGVAGVLMAGYVTAQAQVPLPSSGNSDLWLFVSDQKAGTTFALDTGMSLSSIAPTSSFAPGNSPSTPTAVLSTAIQANFTLGPTAALTSYINAANAAGDTLTWAVEGIQFPTIPTGTGYRKPGGIVGITDNNQTLNTSQLALSPSLTTWAGGFQQDTQYLAGTYVTGGKSYAFTSGSSTGQVWGAGTGGIAGSTDLYGQGPDTAGVGLGQQMNLYALTGNSGLGQAQSYVLGTNLTLSSTGSLSVGAAAVPLPAAVWLFGSGLLGLIGVGRRRAAAA
jgi:hypothetical protein